MTQPWELPVLLEDGSRMDWPDAAYLPDVRISSGLARVTHRLEGAPVLEELAAQGKAAWAAELRCPKTLLARVVTSDGPETRVEWTDAEVDGRAYVQPGLLAAGPLRIPAGALGELWGGDPLDVPAGWWLARGDVRRTEELSRSLLEFKLGEDLECGRMSVMPDSSSGELRFVARLAGDIYRAAQAGDRSLHVAALIGACGHFRHLFGAEGAAPEGAAPDDEGDEGLAAQIREMLAARGAPDWDSDQFDPAAAATALEEFRVAPEPEADDG